jgi:sugar phosphate isomerase/epimerase
MRVSLYTITLSGGYYDGPPVPLLEIFPKAKAWGYDGVEIEAKRPHGNPMDLDAKARKTIRKAAADNGLDISCIAAYNDYSSPVDEHRENELLMTREQIRLAADLGAPIVRVFAAWSGVTRRNGRITYDLARYNLDHRFPGTTQLERWCYVRDCLVEAARMAEEAGVILALQNHLPIITNHEEMMAFVEEIRSPALKACLDPPLMHMHTEEYYRTALQATGKALVHTHYGGRFVEKKDGRVEFLTTPLRHALNDWPLFLRLAKKICGFKGHIGYELCSPVLTGHRFEGLDYACKQAELACRFMKQSVEKATAK